MKRILTSLVVVFALVVSVTAATQAVFNDTGTIAGNTISTATVDIEAMGESRGGIMEKPIIASNLVPGGYTPWARGVVYNKTGSTNVRVYMYVTNVQGVACGKTNLQVTTGHASDGGIGERQYDVYNGALSGLQGAANRKEVTGYIFTDPNWLPANTSAVLQQKAQLDPSAGNSYQNTECTWDEVFVAESIVPTD